MLLRYRNLPYPYNLWSTVLQEKVAEEDLPPDWEAALNHVLATLTHKQAGETLLLYFREGTTLRGISTKCGMTQTAVENKIYQTIQKMRKPHLTNILRHGLDKGREMNDALRTDEVLMASASVEYLNLSKRAVNCLKRARIQTIGQLKECSDEDLFKVRNLGRETMHEIKQALAKFTNPQVEPAAAEPDVVEACTMRDRLVADIRAARTERIKNQRWASDERIADYLLSKGWTLPVPQETGIPENHQE